MSREWLQIFLGNAIHSVPILAGLPRVSDHTGPRIAAAAAAPTRALCGWGNMLAYVITYVTYVVITRPGNLVSMRKSSFRGESQEECVKCLLSAKEWRKSHDKRSTQIKVKASKVEQSLLCLPYQYNPTVSAQTLLVHATSVRVGGHRGSLQNTKVDQELERYPFKRHGSLFWFVRVI